MNSLEQIQIKPEVDHFITVPETVLPSGIVIPSFQVGQYACTQGIDGKAAVSSTAEPWVSISYYEAVDACKKAGYKLITEKQWLALAWNVSQQDCNWSGGNVGKGKLFSGIRNWNVNHAQPGIFVPEDLEEQRWLTISNGEHIFDINGNVYQWVFDDVQGDEKGLIAHNFDKDSFTITTPPYPSEEKGMGKYEVWEWLGYAMYRGGCWNSGVWAGVFSLDVDSPDIRDPGIGFRCTR
ncbi:MAG: SUMF1/EgtB/PvdO family nonheme iron enzyme [Methylotenera sp.]|nr:SUMF1/EgtB/PvdO family nonheme iron enzyme [Methylotenera sp.]